MSLGSCQDQGRSFREANEGDEECDDVFFNSKNESYIIINGDLRKLYAMRPVAVEGLPFAFFPKGTIESDLSSGQLSILSPMLVVHLGSHLQVEQSWHHYFSGCPTPSL